MTDIYYFTFSDILMGSCPHCNGAMLATATGKSIIIKCMSCGKLWLYRSVVIP